MNLTQIKELYMLLTTSDNIFDVRGKLHRACDKVDFDLITKEYLASADIIRMINYIKKEYLAMIEAEKTKYKISEEELQTRIDKLKKLDELFKNCDNPYIRFDKMQKLFKNPGIMHKTYTLLIRYGKDDPKLDEIRPLLNRFSIYYNEFRKSFKNDIHDTVTSAYQEELDKDKISYAKFIIEEYIKSESSFKLNEFLEKYGLDSESFLYLTNIIKSNDIALYYEYIIKRSENDKAINAIYTNIIDDLNYAILNGEFVYGNKFDLLEFIKEIPFKEDKDFIISIDDFMSIHNKLVKENILKYIRYNNLDKADSFKIYSPEDLLKAKIIVGGVTLNQDEIKSIISYLDYRNIPLYKSAFGIASRMYLNNEITLDNVFNRVKKSQQPIIIPKY